MKLVTFQSMDALKSLIEKGFLQCEDRYIDKNKMGIVYSWVVDKMNVNVKNEYSATFPLWCWVKYKNSITPPKHKGKSIKGFDVKITFNKNKDDVFITDFRRYSFLLNYKYIPVSLLDKVNFEKNLLKYNITDAELKAYVRRDLSTTLRTDTEYLNMINQIRDSFDRCITEDSDILQGCVWRIDLKDIEKIEFLNDKEYIYGSVNYVRQNGKRFNWIRDYYSRLE